MGSKRADSIAPVAGSDSASSARRRMKRSQTKRNGSDSDSDSDSSVSSSVKARAKAKAAAEAMIEDINERKNRPFTRVELDEYFARLRGRHDHRLSRLPYILQTRGSVLRTTLLQMGVILVWATMWTVIHKTGARDVAVNILAINVITSIVSLLVAFYSNNNYNRYYEARKAWAAITAHSRNITRLLWSNKLELASNPELSLAAKKCATRTVLAFVVSLRLHLKQPEPATEVKDVQVVNQLMRHVPGFAAHTHLGHLAGRAALDLEDDDDAHSHTSEPDNQSSSENASQHKASSNNNNNNDDSNSVHVSFMEGVEVKEKLQQAKQLPQIPVAISRRATWAQYGKNTEKINTVLSSRLFHEHSTSLWRRIYYNPKLHPGMVSGYRIRQIYLGHTHAPVPVTILNHLGSYLTFIQSNNLSPPAVQNALQASLGALLDNVNSLERILHTPVPLGYVIFLFQVVWIYLLMIPFQLLSIIGWVTIPVSILAAFGVFGIINIGTVLENPFDGQINDLRLGVFVSDLWKECESHAYEGPLANITELLPAQPAQPAPAAPAAPTAAK
ncbi:hypothetical protein GQ42DRAFT_88155 [Ramicandelaber brevisporus]|nr:hypothetical protein GQ42DRAFT_88155 [Ramicandelaber brevisporus]